MSLARSSVTQRQPRAQLAANFRNASSKAKLLQPTNSKDRTIPNKVKLLRVAKAATNQDTSKRNKAATNKRGTATTAATKRIVKVDSKAVEPH